MLILTRYNNQRIVVIAPDLSELWIEADEQGFIVDIGDDSYNLGWLAVGEYDLEGEKVIVSHLSSRGSHKPQHTIGIDAPKSYGIWREEIIPQQEI